MFDHSRARFEELARSVLDRAARLGATAAATDVSESAGLSVNVRKGRVETIEQTRDKGLGVTVHIGSRRGHASTSDFGERAIDQTVRAAFEIARFTGEDPFAGLPDPDTIVREPKDLDLFHPWTIEAAEAIEIAREMEGAAFATDRAIVNSEGASVSLSHGHFVSANSLGFVGGYPYSRHSIACAPIARRGRAMQRDDWYSSARHPDGLADPKAVGRYAAERALSRLGARKLGTRKVPVLFESPLAAGLIGHFVQAASGGALYRKASFLVDALGTPVFSPHIDLDEDPHRPGEFGSTPFDDEGVATAPRRVIDGGVLGGWFLSSYSARKLGMRTTGNAGGSHFLRLSSRETRPRDDLRAMLRKLGTGLFVTELLGHGVNGVTGDYSRGASGYWVEGGKIRYPVEEITIAGNLKDMFRSIVAVGADEIVRGTKRTGSVLIEQMSVAG
ncbi:MAG: metalloprotease PmbA [Burkholderiales bacterium]|nr:metalloprotease PmbA [Burkholderiales bacterium]